MIDLNEVLDAKIILHDNLLNDFGKAAGTPLKELPPLCIGQKFEAIAVKGLGEGEGVSESRLKKVAKALGEVAISAAMTLEVKALITIILTAALPAAVASVGIPVAIGLFVAGEIGKDFVTVYKKIKKHHQKCKAAGMSTKQSLLASIKEHKMEVGALAGAVGLSAIGLDQAAHELVLAVAGSPEIMLGAAGSISDGFLDTAVAGGGRVMEREHKERLLERASLSHKSLTDAAVHKKLKVTQPAQILKTQMKRFTALVHRKLQKLPVKSTSKASSPKR
jgi:hypothetical protein